jgi:hypothetical protein
LHYADSWAQVPTVPVVATPTKHTELYPEILIILTNDPPPHKKTLVPPEVVSGNDPEELFIMYMRCPTNKGTVGINIGPPVVLIKVSNVRSRGVLLLESVCAPGAVAITSRVLTLYDRGCRELGPTMD